MQLNFCHKWFDHDARMIEQMSREAAEARHRESLGYTVVVGDLSRPQCFMEVGPSNCLVTYLDQDHRPHLSYDFVESRGGGDRLFLRLLIDREYKPGSREVIRARSYTFSEDGKVRIMDSDIPSRANKITDGCADVSDYFVKKPAFGEYGEYIRKRAIKLKH